MYTVDNTYAPLGTRIIFVDCMDPEIVTAHTFSVSHLRTQPPFSIVKIHQLVNRAILSIPEASNSFSILN